MRLSEPHRVMDEDLWRSNFDVEHDPLQRVLWGFFNPKTVPSFTSAFLSELYSHDQSLIADHQGGLADAVGQPIDYYVWASRTPGFYSLGGDLAFFVQCIKEQDRSALLLYATQCIEALHLRVCNYNAPGLITVALVQGDALGGGFEAALSSDIIIAEEHVKFGLPEILFNLFPGMGAYSLLCRRIGPRLTEDIMLSGDLYSATACREMGIVDVVVPRGHGEQGVYDYIQKIKPRRNGIAAIYEARRTVSPVTAMELMTITRQWVEAALRLTPKDLRLMTRLVHFQRNQVERCL